jgi:peptide/nickel transport system substrate-binding protein
MKAHLKSFIILLIILSMALPVYCIRSNKARHMAESPRYGGTLRIDVVSPITLLDPTQTMSSGSGFVLPLLYSSLIWRTAGGGYEPDLAEHWASEEGGRIWHFFLRKNARFHDGKPVRPGDVRYSLMRECLSQTSKVFNHLERIDCAEENRLTIRLREPDPSFLDKIWRVSIIPAILDKKVPSTPIGSGPFRFHSRDGQNRVVLTAFDGYYGGKSYIEQIIFTYVPDSLAVWHRLLLGHTDLAYRVSLENELFSRKLARRFYFLKTPTGFVTTLLYNNFDPLFKDPLVRRALTLALDRQYFIDRYLDPASQVASGYFVPESPCHDPSVRPLPYRPVESLRLLEECGWRDRDGDGFLDRNGMIFEFEILVPEGYEEEIKVAREIQVAFNVLGLKVHIKVHPMPGMVVDHLETGRFQAALVGINVDEPAPEADWQGKPRGRYNFVRYSNPRLDELLEILQETSVERSKVELYREIDRLLSQDLPASFLYRKTFCSLVSRRVRNFHLERANAVEFRKLWKSYLTEEDLNSSQR